MPQSALSIHTNNRIWGEAKNPLNQSRTCGGSSGGEAGLISAKCIPLGIGSDIGGSIRFPAAFCGIYGFKPTQTRTSGKGMVPANKARFKVFKQLTGCAGPLGLCVDDLVIGMKA